MVKENQNGKTTLQTLCFLTIGDHFWAQVWFWWSEIDYRVPFKFFTMSGVHVQLQKSWGNLESMSWKEKFNACCYWYFLKGFNIIFLDTKLFNVIWIASHNVFVQFTHWFFFFNNNHHVFQVDKWYCLIFIYISEPIAEFHSIDNLIEKDN